MKISRSQARKRKRWITLVLFFSTCPLLLTEVSPLWLIFHSIFFLLIGLAENYRPPDNAHSYFRDSFYSEFTESSHRSPIVKTFQWGHWQVVFKRARKHSWQVSYRAKCSFHTIFPLSTPWQGWRNTEERKKTSLKCLYRNIRFTLTSPLFRCQTAFNSCAKANARHATMM